MQVFVRRILILFSLAPLAAGSYPVQKPEELLRKGSALMQASRASEAEQTLGAIPESDSSYPAAQAMLGFLLLYRSSLPEAEAAFRHALKLQPGAADARYGLGVTLSRKGLLQDAAGEFEKVLTDPVCGHQARVQLIQCLFWLGKEGRALEEAEKYSEIYPSVAEYQTLFGFFRQLRGDDQEALKAYQRALDLQPSHQANYLNLVSIYRSKKDWSAALHLLQRALRLDPNQPLLHQELAVVYGEMDRKEEAETARSDARRLLEAEQLYARATRARIGGRRGEAEMLLRECIRKNSNLSKAWIDLGDILRRSHRLVEAREHFEKAIETDPSNPLARLGLAAALQEMGARDAGSPASALREDAGKDARDRQAEAALQQAIRDAPGNPDLLFYLGYVYESSGKGREALATYSEVLTINPLQIDALLGRARTLLQHGDTRAALEGFRRATDLEPSKAEAWHGLIEALRKSQDNPRVESACSECLAHLPADSHCRQQLAHARLDAGDFGGAAAQLRALLDNGQESKEILDDLAFALMKLGDLSRATDLFEKSLRRYGQDAWVFSNLGYLYQSRYNYPAACANYRRAVTLRPDDADANHSLGFALYLAKDHSAAVIPLRTAVKMRPGWGMAQFNLAMTYWNLGRYALALTHARLAEEQGVPEAARVVRSLSVNLSLEPPRVIDVRRRKP